MHDSSPEQPPGTRIRALAADLYAEHRAYLLCIARTNCNSATDPEEALQQAFCAFLTHFDPDGPSPPLAWLTLTLKRECWARSRREHLELRAAQPPAPDSEDSYASVGNLRSHRSGIEDQIESRESLLEAAACLRRLKPDERRALLLIGAGYSYREIGSGLGWSRTKINRCASEGRAALRKSA